MKNELQLLLDIDGVILNLEQSMLDYAKKLQFTPESSTIADITAWDLHPLLTSTQAHFILRHYGQDLWLNAKSYPESVQTTLQLYDICREFKVRFIFCTQSYLFAEVQAKFSNLQKLFSPKIKVKKHFVTTLNKAILFSPQSLVIDDSTKNIQRAISSGSPLSICIRRSWNEIEAQYLNLAQSYYKDTPTLLRIFLENQ